MEGRQRGKGPKKGVHLPTDSSKHGLLFVPCSAGGVKRDTRPQATLPLDSRVRSSQAERFPSRFPSKGSCQKWRSFQWKPPELCSTIDLGKSSDPCTCVFWGGPPFRRDSPNLPRQMLRQFRDDLDRQKGKSKGKAGKSEAPRPSPWLPFAYSGVRPG